MTLSVKPIFLFADSQLLFWKKDNVLFLDYIKNLIANSSPKAAYIGASNGDNPTYYSIFVGAMKGIGIEDCRMIQPSFPVEDKVFFNHSDVILLSGGCVERGWNVIAEIGLKDFIIDRYNQGAILMGISAGAVQLGLCGLVKESSSFEVFETCKLVPFIIGAHEEKWDWANLRKAVQILGGSAQGIGIPTGGGAIYYPDHTIEAVRYSLVEFTKIGEEMKGKQLSPRKSN